MIYTARVEAKGMNILHQ